MQSRNKYNDKVANVVRLIISTIGSTFVTKMNKLLFYADFIHYKNHGYGITGIIYKALPFGPVPERWGTLYSSLPGIDMEEFVYPSGQSGIKLESTENIDNNILNESELRDEIPRSTSRPLETITKIAAQTLDGYLFSAYLLS